MRNKYDIYISTLLILSTVCFAFLLNMLYPFSSYAFINAWVIVLYLIVMLHIFRNIFVFILYSKNMLITKTIYNIHNFSYDLAFKNKSFPINRIKSDSTKFRLSPNGSYYSKKFNTSAFTATTYIPSIRRTEIRLFFDEKEIVENNESGIVMNIFISFQENQNLKRQYNIVLLMDGETIIDIEHYPLVVDTNVSRIRPFFLRYLKGKKTGLYMNDLFILLVLSEMVKKSSA